VAKGLGMDPHMKGSVAFLGLTFPTRWNVTDVFDHEAIKDLIARKARERKARTPGSIRSRISTDRKGPGEK
jgi:hypothetical protein